jgi:predicted ABC-type ATPase
MLARFDDLVRRRRSFACESTLASVTLARHLVSWRTTGYQVHVVFLWLPTAEMALERVRLRVETGGHGVPARTVRRRFHRGLANFFARYTPLSNRWRLYDASPAGGPVLIAAGQGAGRRRILNRDLWARAVGTDR